jgi:Ca2+-transporting ATPase
VFAQLRETMIVVLLVAAVLTAATGDLADCVVILLVIIVNTTVGVVQERRAVGAVAALRTLSTPQSTVRRDGAAYRIPTTELVAGDVLQVAGGDIVGADARLLTGHELQVDEALLTGESKPVERDPDGDCPAAAPAADRTTMVHAGTLVVHGSGTAVVVATGVATELGHIATLLHEHSAPDTPLQCRLAALGRRLFGCGRCGLRRRRPTGAAARAAVGAHGGGGDQPRRRCDPRVATGCRRARLGWGHPADGRARRDRSIPSRSGSTRLGHRARR